MKKILSLFALLAGMTASAQSTVQITPISATYTTTPTIQFKVNWTNQSTINHRNKVWIFVDFQTVISPTQKGNWQPATITGTVQKTAGTVSEQSDRGFFLEGAITDFSATVTVQLSNTGTQFNWCAYASDFPPNAFISGGSYTLHGSPPFVVNGNPLAADVTQYGGHIASLTDATGAPGIYCMTAGQAPGKYGCCMGLSINVSSGLCATPTLCDPASSVSLGVVSFTPGTEITLTGSSYTQVWSRPVTATGCQKTTFNGGTVGSVKSDCRTNPSYAGDLFSWCAAIKYADQLCPFPWRVPTPEDICRLHKAVTGANCVEATNANWYNQYVSAWAMQLSGDCDYDGSLKEQGYSCHVLVSGVDANTHFRFAVNYGGIFYFSNAVNPLAGRTLRCVRD